MGKGGRAARDDGAAYNMEVPARQREEREGRLQFKPLPEPFVFLERTVRKTLTSAGRQADKTHFSFGDMCQHLGAL